MKTLGISMTVIFSVILILDIIFSVFGYYEYSKNYDSYWELSVKASSITKKIEGLDKFISALDNSSMHGKYNALFLETPNNSFDENLGAIKSLQIRLHEISGMDISSFQYQTALAQITQQEQNEGGKMLEVFEGIWWRDHHFFLWDWIGLVNIIGCIIIVIVGIGILLEHTR